MKHLLPILLFLFAVRADAVVVAGTVYNALGQPASGDVLIEWPTFTSGANLVQAGSISVKLVNGALSLNLYPLNYYTVTYRLTLGSPTRVAWNVPNVAGPLTILDVQTVIVPPGVSGGGITSLGGLTAASQTFATGTAGTDFAVSSSGSTHTFNLPTVSGANRGAVTSALFNTWNAKENALTFSGPLSRAIDTISCPTCVTSAAALTQYAVLIGAGSQGAASLAALGSSGQCLLSNGAGVAPSFQNCPSGGGGSGDVVGPASAINNAVVLFNGVTGKLIKDSTNVLSATDDANSVALRGADGAGTFRNLTAKGSLIVGTTLASDTVVVSVRRGTDTAPTANIQNWNTNAGVVLSSIDKDGNFTARSATTLALAANGTNCAGGQAAAGVDTAGNAEGCFTPASGTGDVVGPASATDGAVVLFDGATGKLIKDSTRQISASWSYNTVVLRNANGTIESNAIDARGDASQASLLGRTLVWRPTTGDQEMFSVYRGTDTSPSTNIQTWYTYGGSTLSAITSLGAFKGPVIDSGVSGGGVYNVRAYGAVGNGVSDDLSAINSAITAACPSGGVIYFPQGIYAITGKIGPYNGNASTASTCSHITFRGAGKGDNNTSLSSYKGASVIKWTGSAPATITAMIEFAGPALGAQVEDISLDTNNTARVGGIRLQQIGTPIISNVSVISVNSAYGLEINDVNPSFSGTCHGRIDNFFSKASTGGSGFLFDGATTCSLTVTGGVVEYDASTQDRVQFIRPTTTPTNCTGTPSISITGGGGSGASAVGYMKNVGGSQGNVLIGVRVTNMGSGYSSDPSATVTGLSCTGGAPSLQTFRQAKGLHMHGSDNVAFFRTNFYMNPGSSTNSGVRLYALQQAVNTGDPFPKEISFYSTTNHRGYDSHGTIGEILLDNAMIDDCGGLPTSYCVPSDNKYKVSWRGRPLSSANLFAEAVAYDIPTTQRWPIWSVNNVGSTSEAGCYGYRANDVTKAKTCYYDHATAGGGGGLLFYNDEGGMVLNFSMRRNGIMQWHRVSYTIAQLQLEDWPVGSVAFCDDCIPNSGKLIANGGSCQTGGEGTLVVKYAAGTSNWTCL